MKIFAFQHLRDRDLGCELDEIRGREFREPAIIEIDHCLLRVEDLEHLLLVGLGVLVDLFARKRRTRHRAPRRVADHPGEVADQEDDGVPKVLKMFQLADEDGVAKMKVRRGWVESCFHAQRLAGLSRFLQLLAQFRLADDLRRALFYVCELLVYRRKIRHGWDYTKRRYLSNPAVILSGARRRRARSKNPFC